MVRRPKRETVDLSQYPNLVVIYLGMRVNALAGFKTLFGFGPKISNSVEARPDGLLLHENLLYSLRHFGMRQYWRDFEALEKWSRSEPHRQWWQQFLKDSGGTGFWHETYMRRGGIEAVYIDMESPVGLMKFAPVAPARGPMFSARTRAGMSGDAASTAGITEQEFYS
jgi:Monooxygenase af470-like